MIEEDDRLKKEIGAGRRSRASEDRSVTEDRVRTDDDRLRMFQQQMFNDALPDLPPIPGYHVCWLTTTNPRDSIHRRMMLGYTPVTLEDAPGLDHSTLKTGEYAGLIGINEMLAFKLPMNLYEAFANGGRFDGPVGADLDRLVLKDVHAVARQDAHGDGTNHAARMVDGTKAERLRSRGHCVLPHSGWKDPP